MTAEREGVAERWVAVLERMRERQAACLLMAQGTAESEPIRERIEALEAAIRALRQGGEPEPVAWANPGDYEDFVDGTKNAFTVYRHGIRGGDVAIYAAPPSPAKEG